MNKQELKNIISKATQAPESLKIHVTFDEIRQKDVIRLSYYPSYDRETIDAVNLEVTEQMSKIIAKKDLKSFNEVYDELLNCFNEIYLKHDENFNPEWGELTQKALKNNNIQGYEIDYGKHSIYIDIDEQIILDNLGWAFESMRNKLEDVHMESITQKQLDSLLENPVFIYFAAQDLLENYEFKGMNGLDNINMLQNVVNDIENLNMAKIDFDLNQINLNFETQNISNLADAIDEVISSNLDTFANNLKLTDNNINNKPKM